jgi:hypothetical protein
MHAVLLKLLLCQRIFLLLSLIDILAKCCRKMERAPQTASGARISDVMDNDMIGELICHLPMIKVFLCASLPVFRFFGDAFLTHLMYRISLCCKYLYQHLAWSNLTQFNNDEISQKAISTGSLELLMQRKDLLTKLETFHLPTYLQHDWSYSGDNYHKDVCISLFSTLAPRLRHLKLVAPCSGETRDIFFEESNFSLVESLHIDEAPVKFFSQGSVLLPNLRVLKLEFNYEFDLDDSVGLESVAPQLRELHVISHSLSTRTHEARPHIRTMVSNLPNLRILNLCAKLHADGHHQSSAKFWISDSSDLFSPNYIQKCKQNLGVELSAFRSHGKTLWAILGGTDTFFQPYSKGAHVALWRQCNMDGISTQEKINAIAACVECADNHCVAERFNNIKLEIFQFLVRKIKTIDMHTVVPSDVADIALICGVLLSHDLGAEDKIAIETFLQHGFSVATRSPIAVYADIEYKISRRPQFWPKVLGAVIQSERQFIDAQNAFSDVKEERRVYESIARDGDRFRALLEHPNFTASAATLSGKPLMARLIQTAFRLPSADLISLFEAADRADMTIDLPLVTINFRNSLHNDDFFDICCRRLSDYDIIVRHLKEISNVETGRLASMLERIHMRKTGEEDLPAEIRAQLAEAGWLHMLDMKHFDEYSLEGRIDLLLQLDPVIPPPIVGELRKPSPGKKESVIAAIFASLQKRQVLE